MRLRRGFTLIELVSGIVVFSIVVAVSFEVTRRWGGFASRLGAQSSAMGQSRFATIRIADDVRQARYVYHQTVVEVDSNLKLSGISLADWLSESSGQQIGKLWGAPLRDGALREGLTTDRLVMLTGALETPVFVGYFRTKGPANPLAPTSAERQASGLWNRLVRLSMACSGTLNTATGEMFRMDVNYLAAGAPAMPVGKVSFGATAKTLSGDHWTGSSTVPATLNCGATTAQVLATVVPGVPVGDEPRFAPKGVTKLFTLLQEHPAAYSNLLSPYEVRWNFMAGDPNQPLMPGGNRKRSDGTPTEGVVIEGYAFARNVALPQGGAL
ncbi:MAG: prepilin-type N-terminal cleavage/methylation domain-containing protein [Candidatus Sericytochromatia bacterium]|nr:prepilin-type N-terminal cleavage/methylation domain-containing protein [Candidatus Sericytochromatia bacterium]